MSKLKDEGNNTVYSDVSLRYMVGERLLCILMCTEVQDEGNVTVYSYVFLSYRVRGLLLSIVMCV